MKTHKIFFNELSPITETGTRNLIQHELIGTFEKAGAAYLVLKLLKETAYKNLINVETATKNDHMIFLSVEQ